MIGFAELLFILISLTFLLLVVAGLVFGVLWARRRKNQPAPADPAAVPPKLSQ